jgi:signal peptidase II
MSVLLRKWSPLVILTGLILLIDQLTKAWVIENMVMRETRPLVDWLLPYVQLTRSYNTGIAFGLGSGGSGVFLVLSMLIIAGLLVFYWMSPPRADVQHIALGLVIGGALGNVIDRIQHGHVVDFVHIVIPELVSNVSNIADHMIVIGVIVLVIDSFLEERRAAEAAQSAPAEPQARSD